MVTQKWILVKNGERVIEILNCDAEDLDVNDRGEVLEALIPPEHAEAAQLGEWDEEGFVYEFGDDWYMVVPYHTDPTEE
jgi:hypothetical protein